MVNCGVGQGTPGFAFPDDKGNWSGLDVDYCRAVAAAVFGDAKKVSFKPLTAKERFTALQSGEVDVLLAHDHLDHEPRQRHGPVLRRHHVRRRPGADGAQASSA